MIQIDFQKIYLDQSLDGKIVQISGYFSFVFEDIALYPSEKAESNDAVWLTISSEVDKHYEKLKKFNTRKVILTGFLHYRDKSHLNSYYATLSKVSCIRLDN